MEVKDFQNKIKEFASQWAKKRGFVNSEQEIFNHLVEEVGELAREFVNRETRKDKYSEEELNNAILDSMMQLIKLASLRGLDIEEEALKIIEKDQEFLK